MIGRSDSVVSTSEQGQVKNSVTGSSYIITQMVLKQHQQSSPFIGLGKLPGTRSEEHESIPPPLISPHVPSLDVVQPQTSQGLTPSGFGPYAQTPDFSQQLPSYGSKQSYFGPGSLTFEMRGPDLSQHGHRPPEFGPEQVPLPQGPQHFNLRPPPQQQFWPGDGQGPPYCGPGASWPHCSPYFDPTLGPLPPRQDSANFGPGPQLHEQGPSYFGPNLHAPSRHGPPDFGQWSPQEPGPSPYWQGPSQHGYGPMPHCYYGPKPQFESTAPGHSQQGFRYGPLPSEQYPMQFGQGPPPQGQGPAEPIPLLVAGLSQQDQQNFEGTPSQGGPHQPPVPNTLAAWIQWNAGCYRKRRKKRRRNTIATTAQPPEANTIPPPCQSQSTVEEDFAPDVISEQSSVSPLKDDLASPEPTKHPLSSSEVSEKPNSGQILPSQSTPVLKQISTTTTVSSEGTSSEQPPSEKSKTEGTELKRVLKKLSAKQMFEQPPVKRSKWTGYRPPKPNPTEPKGILENNTAKQTHHPLVIKSHTANVSPG